MATTLEDTVRNAACDASVDLADGGTLVLIESTGPTDIASFTLATPAFGSAAAGTATLQGTTLSSTASATGTVDSFEVRASGGAVLWSGSVATSGADINIDNTSINSGQTVELTSYTFTVPAS